MKTTKEFKQLRLAEKISFLSLVTKFLEGEGHTVLRTKEGTIAIPIVLPDGTEDYITINFVSPTGSNKGADPYDGYEEAQDYERRLAEKREKEKEKRKEKSNG